MFERYRHRGVIATLALLYLSQGIPIGLAMDALPTLLRQDGAPLRALAFLPLVGLPWVLKFLWAPWVDNHWFRRLGRRRSWILPMQGCVVVCLLGLAALGLDVDNAGWAVALLAVASLASATQDIATDGMAAEHFSGDLLAKVNAIQVAGVMIGFFVGGAGSLIFSGQFGTRVTCLVLAGLPLASLCCVLALGRDDPRERPPVTAANASLLCFLRRPLAPSLLALALLSAMTAVSGFGLSKLYLSDAGWALQDIGKLGMSGGLVTVLLGCGGGAWLIRRVGLWRGLALGVTLGGGAALLWSLQAGHWLRLSEPLAWTCVMIGSLSTGITSVAILTAAMRVAGQGEQAGTDVTAVQSTRDLGEMLASSFLVSLTAQIGYAGGFVSGAALALLALIVALRLQAREGTESVQRAGLSG
ncbi:RhtX/FptX family siderophore transporter [Salinicola sp. JS01]|uniref:RhtX/FptX family siderophore transporter n=1 Tax=Salinicola sp. JS01 TaxID=3050071 RepID=UPI00255B4238|nr:RhtX/FptX family siderophore transporter [Salinicola sp. JS01]WIX32323.1 RhtX/FptX family siderophore transporter [Salinicola sp. JS01]